MSSTDDGQTVLVIGGAGFLGSHIVARLLETEFARAVEADPQLIGRLRERRQKSGDFDSSKSPHPRQVGSQAKNVYPVALEESARRGRLQLDHATSLQSDHGGGGAETSRVSEIRVFDLRRFDDDVLGLAFTPEDVGVALTGVEGSITSRADLKRALHSVSEVYQCCSIVDESARATIPPMMMEVNVLSNRMILELAPEMGVRRLVYTSTMDIQISFKNPKIVNGTEERPPIVEHLEHHQFGAYGATKAWAEDDVRLADRTPIDTGDDFSSMASFETDTSNMLVQLMRTASIRPVMLHGDRDPHVLTGMLKGAEAGQLKVRMGFNEGVVDHGYVGNVAWAHVCLMDALRYDANACAGQAFLAKDDNKPETLFDWMKPYIEARGVWFPPERLALPAWFFMGVAMLLEKVSWLLRPLGVPFRPLLNPAAVAHATMHRTFSDAKARTVLGYRPVFTPEESRAITMHYFGLDDHSSAQSSSPADTKKRN